MIDVALLHYLIVGITMGLPAFCVGIGQGKAGNALLQALNTQPAAHKELNFLFFLGMAMMEFAGLLGVIMSIMFFFRATPTEAMLLAQAGAAVALVIPASLIGIAAAYPLSHMFNALARQALAYPKLLQQLLLTQIMLQTPVLFGFIMSWIIHSNTTLALSFTQGVQLCASGLTFALGIIGPVLGLTLFANAACTAMGLNRTAHDMLFSFTFISQTIIETPILFVFLMSLWTCFSTTSTAPYAGIVYITSALCLGLTTFAAGISSGRTARAACEQIPQHPDMYSSLWGTSLLGQVFIETNVLYGLIVVFIMIFTLP